MCIELENQKKGRSIAYFTLHNPKWLPPFSIVLMGIFVVMLLLMVNGLRGDPEIVQYSLIPITLFLMMFLALLHVVRWRLEVRGTTIFLYRTFGSRKRSKVIPISIITECRGTSQTGFVFYSEGKKIFKVDYHIVNKEMLIDHLRDCGVRMPPKMHPGVGEL